MLKWLIPFTILLSLQHVNAVPRAINIYSNQQLLDLIVTEAYLQKVELDDCQLVQDIEARAEVLKQPLYQFLWGEMLNHGVCVVANPTRGMSILLDSANQGSSHAMVKLAQYYETGRFVIQNKQRAVQFAYPAAAGGNQKASLMLAKLLSQGYGSPADYELAYHWLFYQVFTDMPTKVQAIKLLQALEAKMPPSKIERARQRTLLRR